jgi:hypothetical protein
MSAQDGPEHQNKIHIKQIVAVSFCMIELIVSLVPVDSDVATIHCLVAD